MPDLFTEDTYEQAIIELFENMGYDHLYAPDLDRDYSSPLLDVELRNSPVYVAEFHSQFKDGLRSEA